MRPPRALLCLSSPTLARRLPHVFSCSVECRGVCDGLNCTGQPCGQVTGIWGQDYGIDPQLSEPEPVYSEPSEGDAGLTGTMLAVTG